jgi:hypothetical protein
MPSIIFHVVDFVDIYCIFATSPRHLIPSISVPVFTGVNWTREGTAMRGKITKRTVDASPSY